MSGVPSAGWREVYESCHVSTSADDGTGSADVPEAWRDAGQIQPFSILTGVVPGVIEAASVRVGKYPDSVNWRLLLSHTRVESVCK